MNNTKTRIIDHIAHCPQHDRHYGISDQEIEIIEWWLTGAVHNRITQTYICDTITLKPYNDAYENIPEFIRNIKP